MKVVIFAGGYGTRISEESSIRPKPMVEIGERPILWHIMKLYSAHGIYDFIICCGYKGYMIKEYFANYFLHHSDVTFDLKHNGIAIHQNDVEPWKVTLIDTGEATMTAGRLQRVQAYIGQETFCLTYGDGVSDINITALIKFHHDNKRLVTLTAVQPPGRFGTFTLPPGSSRIKSFQEKPEGDGAWINGGFFVLEPGVFKYMGDDADQVMWESGPLTRLARDGELLAYRHMGFWHPMDTLRDKHVLEDMWRSGKAPWHVWV
jgi:glucose-1-phosphate cytidylyltransferase